jgi:hypothetical protein
MYILPEKPAYYYYDFDTNLTEDSYFIASSFPETCYKYRLFVNSNCDNNNIAKALIGNFFIDNNLFYLLESSINIPNNDTNYITYTDLSRLL